ncbi:MULTISPECIES: cysteine--tRNA ligase [Nonomuraea]|uniref:Cysteine--tRNA ligase n=1 Tax=Nonomuraea ferruginea TaxID=46174 RepID=A0ABT4SVX2_9ACTN|nr:cysteine--tRNA ligase [Nonomuraea ferruginea]MDA0641397.1 cysteine--tRNA ligase [Nonomuraea ferruginea]
MLRIYDTLTGQVEEIAPARGLRMYACAPPVHRRADLGDLRPALLSDLIRRVLERHRVRMVVCLGVDDVGCPVESARAYEEASARDAAALNLRSPELSPRAAEHAGEVVELVAALVERGHAYAADGGWVFFDSAGSPSYGELSGEKDPNGGDGFPHDGERSPHDGGDGFPHDGPERRRPADWVLWRPADGEAAWDSPWGRGVPGPHVACSAMSSRRLGDRVDIQTGGTELIFPHHEAMRAQSDAAAGHEVVRRWAHSAGLAPGGSAPGPDGVTPGDGPRELAEVAEAGLDPLAVRLAFLQHHYRGPLDLTWDVLRAADGTLRRLRARVAEWSESPSAPMAAAYVRRAESALDDDLDTPAALRVLEELERDDSVPPGAKFESFLHLDHVLALDLPADIGKPRP